LNIELSAPECSLKIDYWRTLELKMFAPIMLAAYLCLFKWCIDAFKISRENGFVFNTILKLIKDNISVTSVIVSPLKFFFVNLVVVAFSFYIPIVSNLTSPLICSHFGTQGKAVVVNNRSQECYTDIWKFYVVRSASLLFIYMVVLPGILILLIRGKYDLWNDPELKSLVNSIVGAYKPKYYFWEFVKMFHRSLFVLLPQLSTDSGASSEIRIRISIAIFSAYSATEVYLNPHLKTSSKMLSSA
jgi:hypothetical protein